MRSSQSIAERHVSGVDAVADIGLVVVDLQAARPQEIAGAARELDVDDRVAPSVGDERAQLARGSSRSACQPSTVGTNPENARIPAGGGRSDPRPSA